ncbi:MAG: hypothetical protein ABJB74_11820 [Gemmatimonas sp.]
MKIRLVVSTLGVLAAAFLMKVDKVSAKDLTVTACSHCVGNGSSAHGHCEDNDNAYGPYSCTVATNAGFGYPVCWDNAGKCCRYGGGESLNSTGASGNAEGGEGCGGEEQFAAGSVPEAPQATVLDCKGRIVARHYAAEAESRIIGMATALSL